MVARSASAENAAPSAVSRDGTAPELDESLWQVTCGSDAGGCRDVTDEVGDLIYSHVRPGGPASCSSASPPTSAASATTNCNRTRS